MNALFTVFWGHVLHVNNRTVGPAPGPQQRGDIALGAGVVPLPPARVVETLLHIDQE